MTLRSSTPSAAWSSSRSMPPGRLRSGVAPCEDQAVAELTLAHCLGGTPGQHEAAFHGICVQLRVRFGQSPRQLQPRLDPSD